jgi:hypothetical protein
MPRTLSSKTIVWVELIADMLVAVVKLAAAFFTGSAAIAAEGVHSVVDVGSGGLMLYGYRRAQLGPSKRHPFGHGRELYFWSFVVALLFFTLGAGYSIFEGVRRILSPADIRSPLVIYIVPAAEALFDGVSFVLALRAFSAAKGDLGYWEAMTKSKDAPSFIVLAEDTAGLVGIAVHAPRHELRSSGRGWRRLGRRRAGPRIRRLGSGAGEQGPLDWRTGKQRAVPVDPCPGREPRRRRRREWRCRHTPCARSDRRDPQR